MRTDVRYQNGFLYEHPGAWYVRYYQRTSKEDGTQLNHASKHLGRSKDFRNISDVELCRASFMQAVNRDRLSANSRITLTAFVEGAYLPWTKERRASTSKGDHEISIHHIRNDVGSYICGNFAPWMPVECCARSPKRARLLGIAEGARIQETGKLSVPAMTRAIAQACRTSDDCAG